MQTKEFELDSLEVDVDLGRSIVECLLHTVFFLRAFGPVVPVDCELEGVPGVSYARINDDALDHLVKQKSRQFLDLQIAGKSSDEITVSFYEKQLSTRWFGTKQEENVCWERWVLRFHFTGMGTKQVAPVPEKEKAGLAESILRRMHYILKVVSSQQEHIPVVKNQEVLPFPYSVDVPEVTQGSAASIWENLFPRK